MHTNRDFYKALEGLLIEQRGKPSTSLEEYLCSLRVRAAARKDETHLSLETLYTLLADAFSPATEGFEMTGEGDESAWGFLGWDAFARRQILDLRQMRQSGQLEDEQRCFGIDAPSGQRWYNFDPCGYIECGAAGSLGGWMEGDKTGRSYVPGKVAVVTKAGELETYDPRELDRLPAEISIVTWELFKDFLWCGQHYE